MGDGAWHWVVWVVEVEDADGEPTWLCEDKMGVWFSKDVTEAKKYATQLAAQREYFTEVSFLPDGAKVTEHNIPF